MGLKKGLVALDIGHTVSRPGAMAADGTDEFGLNRSLAGVIGEMMPAGGSFKIGDDGNGGPAKSRQGMAYDRSAGFLLSVHHDSAREGYLEKHDLGRGKVGYATRNPDLSGFSLWVSGGGANPQMALACAKVIGSNLVAAGFKPSRHHGMGMGAVNIKVEDARLGVHSNEKLSVLKGDVPAVLLEAGVMVNELELGKLKDMRTKRVMAQAVANGLKKCGASN